jgi:4-amino-4-deoxy-L-arabinose transferase-like glycosyltransferase
MFLSRHLLVPFSAFLASLLFALNPMIIRISNSLQPEGLMLLFYILAVYSFIRWLDEGIAKWYWLSILATSLTILVKVNALHIGLLFVGLLIYRKGIQSIRSFSTWAFPVLALSPAVLWYIHAHGFWLDYGNSLGVSNEYHWVGWDLFSKPEFIIRLAKIEINQVWMYFGGLVALLVIIKQRKSRVVIFSFAWLIAILMYYLVAIRTTADFWASYYHVVSVPPAALILGKSFDIISSYNYKKRQLFILLFILILVSLSPILGRLSGVINKQIFDRSNILILSFFISIALVLLPFITDRSFRDSNRWLGRSIMTFLLLFGIVSTLYFYGLKVSGDLRPRIFQSRYECAKLFQSSIPEESLIIASGGDVYDETGYPVAYNAPYMFYWLDRKGFSLPIQRQSLDNVNALMKRGACFYVLEKRAAESTKGFKEQLEQNYTLLEECDVAFLFGLTKDMNKN